MDEECQRGIYEMCGRYGPACCGNCIDDGDLALFFDSSKIIRTYDVMLMHLMMALMVIRVESVM